jgi:hypothetical protein
MPNVREFLAYYERERARHFEAAGWLFAGYGGVLVSCGVFREQVSTAVIALAGLGFAGAVVFLGCVLIARRIVRDPPHPASGLLIALTIGSFVASLLALLASLGLILIRSFAGG